MNSGQFPKSVPLHEEAQVIDTVMNSQNVSQQTFIQQVLRQILDYAFFLDSFYHARLNPPLTTIAPGPRGPRAARNTKPSVLILSRLLILIHMMSWENCFLTILLMVLS